MALDCTRYRGEKGLTLGSRRRARHCLAELGLRAGTHRESGSHWVVIRGKGLASIVGGFGLK